MHIDKSEGKNMVSNVIWKVLERFGVQGVQFIVQLILARILEPEHYGMLSIMIIFTTFANVFIQYGFNTSLIQNKDVTDEDYSSVFWVSLGIAIIMYFLLFVSAPLVAEFYGMPDIVNPFRAISLMIIPGALNSVQTAKVSREMNFKKVFFSNISGIIVSGAVGIAIACMGGGFWALVAQSLLNVTVACVVMLFTVKWHPQFVCNLKRVNELFLYGWKILSTHVISLIYQNLSNMFIGKKYNADILGFYNRGRQFPMFIINAIDGTIQSVLLSAMSALQNDKKEIKRLMKDSVAVSSYVNFPIMIGLACVAEPLVSIVLTDKWLPCVPYIQIFCISLILCPLDTTNSQVINSMGRSDIFLKIEIIKKIFSTITLIAAILCFDSPIAVAMANIINICISCALNIYPNKALIDYSYLEQFRDIIPYLIMSLIMCVCVNLVSILELNAFLLLCAQVLTGICVYLILSFLFKPKAFGIIMKKITKTE